MKLAKEARKLSKALFRASFTNGVLDGKKVGELADLVIKDKPRQYVGVLKELARLVRLELAKRHATIESATELDSAEKDNLIKTLKARFGADITTEFKTQPNHIGGVRIQIGSDVFDSTVRNRLDRLSLDLAA